MTLVEYNGQLYNLTNEQVRNAIQPQGLVEQVITAPWLWILLSIVVIAFVVIKLKGNQKQDPSTKPFYYRDFRKGVMQKEMKKRFDTLGRKLKNYYLEKGVTQIGVATSIEYDRVLFEKKVTDPKTKSISWQPDFWYRVDRIQFRKHGMLNWVMAQFGYGLQYIVVTPDSYTIDRGRKGKRKYISIDPAAHLIADSEVWTLADARTMKANLEFVMKAEHENLHGSELDNLRRQAVHSVSVAAQLEKMSHETDLKDKDRKSRISPYV